MKIAPSGNNDPLAASGGPQPAPAYDPRHTGSSPPAARDASPSPPHPRGAASGTPPLQLGEQPQATSASPATSIRNPSESGSQQVVVQPSEELDVVRPRERVEDARQANPPVLMQQHDIMEYEVKGEAGAGNLGLSAAFCDDSHRLGGAITNDDFIFDSDTTLRGRSFGLLPPASPFRKGAARLVTSRRYRIFLNAVTYATTAGLYASPRRVHGAPNTQSQALWRALDWAAVGVFILDTLLNCAAFGCILGVASRHSVLHEGVPGAAPPGGGDGDPEAPPEPGGDAGDGGGGGGDDSTLAPPHPGVVNYTYLGGSMTNRADLAITAAAVVFMSLGHHGLHVLKVLRCLPHAYFPEMRSVRAVFEAVRRSIGLLVDNIMMLVFFICFFSICAVEFFAGGHAFNCVFTDPEMGLFAVPIQHATCNGNADLPIYRGVSCPTVRNATVWCKDVGNEKPGWLHFDNFGTSSVAIFQIIQLENWGGVMRPLLRSRGVYLTYIFFVVLIVVCNFVVINLFTAIVVFHFDEVKGEMEEEDPDASLTIGLQYRLLRDAESLLPGCLASRLRRRFPECFDPLAETDRRPSLDPRDRIRRLSITPSLRTHSWQAGRASRRGSVISTLSAAGAPGSPTGLPALAALGQQGSRLSLRGALLSLKPSDVSPEHTPGRVDPAAGGGGAGDAEQGGGGNLDAPQSPRAGRRSSNTSAHSGGVLGSPRSFRHSRGPSFLESREMTDRLSHLGIMQPSTQEEEDGVTEEEAAELAEDEDALQCGLEAAAEADGAAETLWGRLARAYLDWVMLAALVGNVVVLSLWHHDISERRSDMLEHAEYGFLSLYTLEQAVRVVRYPRIFRESASYWVDLSLLLISVPVLFDSRLRVFRTFRVFRIIFMSDVARDFLSKLNVEPILSLFYMMAVVLVLFAVIGYQMFSGLFSAPPDEMDFLDPLWVNRFHFDSILHGVLTLFVVMTGDNWSYPMYQAMLSKSDMLVPAMLYFYAFIVTANWVLLSMFIAVLLQEFDTYSLLDRNLENHEIVSQSRSVFSNFLRNCDMDTAAAVVDEENLISLVSVANMHKWACRARASEAKRTTFKQKLLINKSELRKTARILEGRQLTLSAADCIRTLQAQGQGQGSTKGVNKFRKTEAFRRIDTKKLLHLAKNAESDILGSVERVESELLGTAESSHTLKGRVAGHLAQMSNGGLRKFRSATRKVKPKPEGGLLRSFFARAKAYAEDSSDSSSDSRIDVDTDGSCSDNSDEGDTPPARPGKQGWDKAAHSAIASTPNMLFRGIRNAHAVASAPPPPGGSTLLALVGRAREQQGEGGAARPAFSLSAVARQAAAGGGGGKPAGGGGGLLSIAARLRGKKRKGSGGGGGGGGGKPMRALRSMGAGNLRALEAALQRGTHDADPAASAPPPPRPPQLPHPVGLRAGARLASAGGTVLLGKVRGAKGARLCTAAAPAPVEPPGMVTSDEDRVSGAPDGGGAARRSSSSSGSGNGAEQPHPLKGGAGAPGTWDNSDEGGAGGAEQAQGDQGQGRTATPPNGSDTNTKARRVRILEDPDDDNDEDFDPDAEEPAEDDLRGIEQIRGSTVITSDRRGRGKRGRTLHRASLFLFHENHRLRLAALRTCKSEVFQHGVTAIVAVSSLLLMFSPAGEAWGDVGMHRSNAIPKHAAGILNYVFLSVFFAEFLIKVVAYGFIWMAKPREFSRRRERAYLRDPWNCLDFAILLVMAASLMIQQLGKDASALQSFRIFRVLRVIRVIRRVANLRKLLQALMHPQTLIRISGVLILVAFFYLSFALIAVALLSGSLGHCTDGSIHEQHICSTGVAANDIFAQPLPAEVAPAGSAAEGFAWEGPEGASMPFLPLETGAEPAYLLPRVWRAPWRNFDTIGSAMVTLLTVASGEDWATPMLYAMDSTSSTTGPQTNNNPAYALFFVGYMILMSFIVINLVIFVITDAIRTQSGTAVMMREQVEWSDLMHYIKVVRPLPRVPPPKRLPDGTLSTTGKIRSILLRYFGPRPFSSNRWFEAIIYVVILLNVAMILTEYRTDKMSETHKKMNSLGNTVIVSIYVFEFVVKLVGLTPPVYFQDRYNRLDAFIVAGSMMGWVTQGGAASEVFSNIRIIRLLRIFKLVRLFKGVGFIIDSIFASIPAIINVVFVVGLFMFVWGAVGSELFGGLKMRAAINTEINFRSFFNSFCTLTMVITSDDWINILHEATLMAPDCSTRPPMWLGAADGGVDVDLELGFNDCGPSSAAALLYFISFYVLGSYIFLNLVTASILDEVQHAISRDRFRVTEGEIEAFRVVWFNTLQGTSGDVPRWRMSHLMESLFLVNKLGLHPIYHKKFYNTFLLKLDWLKLRFLIHSKQKGNHACDVKRANAELSLLWPPPLWESYTFHEVLHLMCHHAYEDVALDQDEVEAHRVFQKKADRLLATQVIQSVVRTIFTLHMLERDKHPELILTSSQKLMLAEKRRKIRGWTAAISTQRAKDPRITFRLFKLPNILKKINDSDSDEE